MQLKKLKIRILGNYFLASLSIILVLFTLGLISLLIFNTAELTKNAKEKIIITLILKKNLNENQKNELIEQLESRPYTKTIKYVSEEQALEDLKESLGENIDDVLDFNPLPPTIDMTLKSEYANTDSIFKIKKEILAYKGIEDLFYNQSVVNQLDINVKKISFILSIVIFIILTISIVLINNTVRLTVYARRFEIKTMQKIGASWIFILKPFLKNGLLHGIFTSLMSLVFLLGFLLFFKNSTKDFYIKHIFETMLIVFITGTLITTISTLFSVFSYIRKPVSKLYAL